MILRIVKTDLGKFHLLAMLQNGQILHEHFDNLPAATRRAKSLSNVPVVFIKLK